MASLYVLVQNGPDASPALCTVGARSFLGGKSAGGKGSLTTHACLASRLRIRQRYAFGYPVYRYWHVMGRSLHLPSFVVMSALNTAVVTCHALFSVPASLIFLNSKRVSTPNGGIINDP